MASIKVTAAALNQIPLDWDGNIARIKRAAILSSDSALICYPELCISGYGCEDLFLAPWFRERSALALRELLSAPELSTGAVHVLGLPIEHGGRIFDSAAVIQSGKLLGITCKKHLAFDGIHYENRWFTPWPVGVHESCALANLPSCPIGDVWYDFGGISMGIEICHDAWVAERHSKQLAERGVQIICNPSASHFAFGKRAVREQLIKSAAREHCEVYVYANLLGCESGRAIFDGDRVIAAHGEQIASGERLILGDVAITSAIVEVNAGRGTGVGFFGARKHPAARGEALALSREETTKPTSTSGWESSTGEQLKFEEFTRAVSLGLFDYGRKSHAKSFALSLSGGADSSACAVLIDFLSRRIITALKGSEMSALWPELSGVEPSALLSCAYQSTAQSSASTLNSARALCESIGIKLIEFDVQPLVDGYVSMAERAVDQKLSWNEHDLALQNIQSRARAPGIWLLANIRNALLLTTANRSEAAVGYATMDGDTAGGLAPLGGVSKDFIRRWLRWMERTGPYGFAPYPALSHVNSLTPTAELRPGGTQTDEGDLMPYEVLAELERAAVRYYRSETETRALLANAFSGRYSETQLDTWTSKFFRLFYRSQWKRERYAPAFHLDDFSLDPKSWLRMPILTTG